MKNIYDLVSEFYDTLERDDSAVITKEIVEKYIRTEIWRRIDESTLVEQWNAIRILLDNLARWEYEDFFYVSPSDYQEIFFQYADMYDLPLKESTVRKFFSLIRPLFLFYLKTEKRDEVQFYDGTFRDGKKSFYLYGKFSLPPRRLDDDDFFVELEHDSNMNPEITDKLNSTIDTLLFGIKKYFNIKKYANDLNRAFGIFYGPMIQDGDEILEREQQRGFVTFWDFFLFDYHCIDEDETPIYIFYKLERENLTYAEDQILRDLMGAQLRIFFIEDQDEEHSICRNLLTDEQFELPPTPVDYENLDHMVFIGHIRAEGVMLLDHVVGYPASQNLRARIKREILRAYDLFKYQKPKARITDFLARESAMVRHIIRVLSAFAQLNVVPLRDFPKPLQTSNEKIPPAYKNGAKRLRMVGQRLGISAYGLNLLLKMYSDFLFIFPGSPQQKQSDAALLAVLYLFYHANDLPTQGLDAMTKGVESLKTFALKLKDVVNSVMKVVTFDPRYAIEDGYVCLLFWKDS